MPTFTPPSGPMSREHMMMQALRTIGAQSIGRDWSYAQAFDFMREHARETSHMVKMMLTLDATLGVKCIHAEGDEPTPVAMRDAATAILREALAMSDETCDAWRVQHIGETFAAAGEGDTTTNSKRATVACSAFWSAMPHGLDTPGAETMGDALVRLIESLDTLGQSA